MRRHSLIPATAISTLIVVAAFLPATDVHSGAAKGIQVIVVDGAMLESPIRVTEVRAATALFNSLVGPLRLAVPVGASRSGRACLRLGAFLQGPRTAALPVDELRPEQGDIQYQIYPASGEAPAVLVFAGNAYSISSYALEQLESHDIPVEVGKEASPACTAAR
jgi:hypothetical protein